jgi:hypothetical protein
MVTIHTAYDTICDQPTAGISWSYPGDAITPLEERVPYGPINAVLGAFYNRDTGPVPVEGEHPYFHVISDEFGRQVGLILADIGDADLDDDAVKLNLFNQGIEEARRFPQPVPWQPGDWRTEMFWDAEFNGLAGIRWRLPQGQAFPAQCLNHVFNWFYQMGIQPFVYPVFNPRVSPQHVPQVGLLVSSTRDESGTAEEIAQYALEDLQHLFGACATLPVPWAKKEF